MGIEPNNNVVNEKVIEWRGRNLESQESRVQLLSVNSEVETAGGGSIKSHRNLLSCKELCCSLTLCTFGLTFLVLGVIFMSVSLQEVALNESLSMRPELPTYKEWQTPNLEVTMKFYAFNVTNAERFVAGLDDQLHLEEVGPITYFEINKHKDVVFHENSTLSYTATRELRYADDRNEPGILNRTIIIPNLITLVSIPRYMYDFSTIYFSFNFNQ